MENWGLITYAESMLCVDKTVSGAGAIVSSATVVAHEVSHQVYFTISITLLMFFG
jgi:aminopeptidase N